jgi:hypothetical protein
MGQDRPDTGDAVPDEVPTLGEGPERTGTPVSASTMLKRDQLLKKGRSDAEEPDEVEGESRVLQLLLLGLVAFLLVDVGIVAYRFGWVGGARVEAPPPPPPPRIEAPRENDRPVEIEGVKVKEGMSDGLGRTETRPEPAQRPVNPPGL